MLAELAFRNRCQLMPANPSESFEFRSDLYRWRQLVSPAWLATLLAGEPVPMAPGPHWRLLEVGFDGRDAFIAGHIPGAGYLDTTALEKGPLWNKIEDAALLRLLCGLGIRHDTTVVLYGRNMLAAARAAHLMLYAGVSDVRLLDGGLGAWLRCGLPLAQGWLQQPAAVADFGIASPAHPEYLSCMQAVWNLPRGPDACLVSVRTWNEYVGKTSGYCYIEARGEIPGAVWGRAGNDDDVNSMSEFHDTRGRMRTAADIGTIWHARGLHRERQIIFYCGTGWRASLAFFYAWLMGWKRISVYDGGWLEWSASPHNAVQRLDDAGAASPCFQTEMAEKPLLEF